MAATDQKIFAAYEAAGGNAAEAARKLGITSSAARHAVRRFKASSSAPAPKSVAPASKLKSRTLADFRAQFDRSTIVPGKIDAALRELGAGWMFEHEFAAAAGVSLLDLGAYRDQYADHLVIVNRERKRIWAGTRKLAEQMRAAL